MMKIFKTTFGKYLAVFVAGGLVFLAVNQWLIPNISSIIPFSKLLAKELDVSVNINYDDEEELRPYINKYGIKELMSHLVKKSSGGSSFDCHQQSHQIGRIGYKEEKEKAFQSCDANCHSGCYHGAMETFLNENGTANLAKNITRICKSFETSFGNFECLHGVGHGVLAYLDYDLPESINTCQDLKDGFSVNSCYGGLFMENILTGQGLGASEKEHDTEWVDKNSPYLPCNKIDQNYDLQYQCYQMQTSWMLTIANYNFDTVIGQCEKAPRKDMIPVCFKSLGRDIAGHTLRNPAEILKLCDKVPSRADYRHQCLTGALHVIVDFWGPGLKDQATELCRLSPKSLKETCYRELGWRVPDVFKARADQERLCATYETEYKNLCQMK